MAVRIVVNNCLPCVPDQGFRDKHSDQPGNYDDQIDLTDDCLKDGQGTRRRCQGCDIAVTQSSNSDKTEICKKESTVFDQAFWYDKRPWVKVLHDRIHKTPHYCH